MTSDVERTAVGPTFMVAIEQYVRPPLVVDPWAGRILPRRWRLPVALSRFAVVRRLMISATEKLVPGAWISLLCRKRYIDDLLREAVRQGVDAVVILGAGFDTRGYRVDELAGLPIWEVDLPHNIAVKDEALRRCFGRVPSEVTLVPMDFESDNLMSRLADQGYAPDMRTFFIWESVTMYLSEDSVRSTLRALRTASRGSRLAFTYFRSDFLDGSALHGADEAHEKFVVARGLWKFGLDPADVAAVLHEYGWEVVENIEPAEYRDRYLRPAHRDQTVSPIERAAYASRS